MEPTPASIWQTISGGPISDEFLEWPADLFALTEVLLARSGIYRFVLSPPAGVEWPPSRLPDWSTAVEEAGRQWNAWIEHGQGSPPALLVEEWRAFRECADKPFEKLAEGNDWQMCEALLTLHAIADEACAGVGVALDRSDGEACRYRARGRELLARTGSLSRLSPHAVRVLPKIRTPPNGTSLRAFSRYACVRGCGVETHWYKVPCRRAGTASRARHANMLLLPWPLRVRESDFRPLEHSVQRLEREPFGFFEFAPAEKLDLDLMERVIVCARDEVDSVDVVILPESAVDEADVDGIETVLARQGVSMLVTGVRQRSPGAGLLPANWVHIGANPSLEKGALGPGSTGEQWFHVRQNKHHRWSLDERQVLQYHLGGALHPYIRWWEAMEVPRRELQFIELGDGVTLVSLVCEDLAQIDEVAEEIRSVGPTVVLTPLLDGPQLNSRWAARYASVLADDPGSAVLTLTAYGMVKRSRPQGHDVSAVIGLWKDPVRGMREIPLEPGAQGVLLTVCGGQATRRTVDGRAPVDSLTHQFDVAVHQVRVTVGGSGLPARPKEAWIPRSLDTGDLTILTGWAEAVTEAVAYNPDYVWDVLADVEDGAPWRADFNLPEPSPQLSEAMKSMARAVQAARMSDGKVGLHQLHANCAQGVPNLSRLEQLVHRVLRSTMEQFLTLKAMEPHADDVIRRAVNG
jgi:hypothetical protein